MHSINDRFYCCNIVLYMYLNNYLRHGKILSALLFVKGDIMGCSLECDQGPVSQQARHVLNPQRQGLNVIEIFLSATLILTIFFENNHNSRSRYTVDH